MTHLLDANVLIALSLPDHSHHDPARSWFAAVEGRVSSCPVTQGSLLRTALRAGAAAADAGALLAAISAHDRHEFWPDAMTYLDVDLSAVIGHRQVTDAYLAALARHHRGRVATFDRGLATAHPDVAVLVDGAGTAAP